MIAGLIVALLLAQPVPPAEPDVVDVVNAALPEIDGEEPWAYLGTQDAYTDIWYAASDYWLHEERMGGRSILVRYSARPSRGFSPFRQVVVRRYQGAWNQQTRTYEGPYVYAQRLSYSSADVMAAFSRAYPAQDAIRAFGARTRIDEDWERDRETFDPDYATVIRLIQPQREALDERTCPALRPALERLNLIEIPPVHLSGFGPDRRPLAELDDGTVVVTGDGTGFLLEIPGQRGWEGQHHQISLLGNHGSIPGEWIERFEAETADCWRPDDGGDPPG